MTDFSLRKCSFQSLFTFAVLFNLEIYSELLPQIDLLRTPTAESNGDGVYYLQKEKKCFVFKTIFVLLLSKSGGGRNWHDVSAPVSVRGVSPSPCVPQIIQHLIRTVKSGMTPSVTAISASLGDGRCFIFQQSTGRTAAAAKGAIEVSIGAERDSFQRGPN